MWGKKRKLKKIFKFKGDYETTELARNFVRYMTDPFSNSLEENEEIDLEHEIYLTYIESENNNKYNIAFSTYIDFAEDTEKIINIVKPYIENNLELIWFTITDTYHEKEVRFFESLGLLHSETYIGMIKDISEWRQPKIKKDENIRYLTVNSNARLKDFSEIWQSAFGSKDWDYDFYKTLLKANRKKDLSRMNILYKNNQPAVTGNLYYEKNMAIIDDIATHQKFRRQGLAKLMINYLVNQAKKEDYELVGLVATPQGFSMYKKMGFHPINLYINKYVTKIHTSNLEHVARKISKGKITSLQTVEIENLHKQIDNQICATCQQAISENTYILSIKSIPNFSMIAYHEKCYRYKNNELWVIIAKK